MECLVDWEQRRYEIAKSMLSVIYLDEGQQSIYDEDDLFEYKTLDSCASEAVRFADALIKKLKEKK